MSSLPRYNLPKKTSTYPSLPLDNSYGQTITVDLYRVDLVHSYIFNVVLGSLSGGSSPAWNVSATNPLITHVSIYGDNEPIFDADYQMFMEEAKLVRNFAPTGTNGMVLLGVRDYMKKGSIFEVTALPSFKFTQLQMRLTIAPLSQVTTGSPTGSSGTTLYLQEEVNPLSVLPKGMPILDTRKLQISTALPLTGVNDLTEFLSKDGAYAAVLFAAMTGSSVNYANLTDSLISELKLEINNQTTIFDDYWNILKAQDQAMLQTAPDTGYALKAFAPEGVLSDFLDLTPSDLKRVDLKVTTTGTGVLAALKTEVFPRLYEV
ncbi:MAG: hypothetical protein RXR82_06320 [Nitrososphaeria archaeon]